MRTYLSYAITRPAHGRILVGIVIWSCWILLQQFALGQGKIERHPQSLNHVAPDSWVIAGGNHTAIPFVIDRADTVRVVLVVATTTQVHLEVQQLLNRLNSLTSSNLSSPSGLNTAGRGITYPTPAVEHAPERFDDRVHYPRGY